VARDLIDALGAFANLAPELAGLGLAAFTEQNLCLIGTLRAGRAPARRLQAVRRAIEVTDPDLR
jgi:hypothetical protein